MNNYGTTKSTIKPQPTIIDDFSVWVNSDIKELSENIGQQNEFIGYEYDMTCYDKNEYIALMAEKNETQIADIYTNIYNSLPSSVQAEMIEEEYVKAQSELEGILK